MLSFSPSTNRLWQSAAFSLFYSSLPLILIRILIFFFLILLVLIGASTGVHKLSYLGSSLLGVVSMAELFYHFKLLKILPAASTEKLSANTNMADLLTLRSVKILLAHPNWSSTGSILNALSFDLSVRFVLNKAGISKEDLDKYQINNEKNNLATVVQAAEAFAAKEGDSYLEPPHLLAGLFADSSLLKKVIFDKELKEADLANIIHWSKTFYMLGKEKPAFWERSTSSLGLGMANIWMGGWTLETEKYTKDLTFEVTKNKSHLLVGRDKEIGEVEKVLMRTQKRNVILLGDPGIGKTTIVYGLAERSVKGELPEELKYKRFMEIDVTSMLAGASGGELEDRVKAIFEEITHAGDVVLFIPAIENLAGNLEGGKLDISGLIQTWLEDSGVQIIGTSSRNPYHKFIESKGVFSNNFEVIDIPEPSEATAIRIMEEASTLIETKHKVVITYKSLQKAVELSERYLVDKVLPGKAIDILDETAGSVALSGKKLVETEEVEKVITDKTKVPANLARGEEKEKLIKLETILHERIVGQDQAVESISTAIRRARTLNRDTTKPIGVFLFLGPTGVGKTETAKALAQVYYGSEERIIRLDMSGFNQEASVARLIGTNPGAKGFEEGGQLTEAVRVNPFSLVLLDELEKAHVKVQELFLSIFDEGRIKDSSGRPISFTNTIIIGTSNAGAEFIREQIQKGTDNETLKKELIERLLQEGTFKPEFLNRFDDVIVYHPLDTTEVQQVVVLMLKHLVARLAKQDIKVEILPEVVAYLAQKGYDPTFGARPLQRTIQDEVESRISKAILEGKVSRGAQVKITLVNDTITIS